MDILKKLIKKDSLEKLFSIFQEKGKTIYAPVKTGEKSDFQRVTSHKELTYDYIQTIQSAKKLVFPRVENLFFYTNTQKETTVQEIDLQQVPETIVWAAHPCDAHSFATLKSTFEDDFYDKILAERHKKLTIVGLTCTKSDSNCFCTSMGLSPRGTKGSDILLTPLQSGDYLAEIVTKKGAALVELASNLFENVTGEVKEVESAKVDKQFNYQSVVTNATKSFNSPFWVENSLRCIGCGACAYVCPTCTCFDIQDESKGKNGKRLRCWDSCGLAVFTLHTSGHNPREVQSQRWRQRLMHKFSYIPERNTYLGCVGCGKCSRACPTDMNILEQLSAIEKTLK